MAPVAPKDPGLGSHSSNHQYHNFITYNSVAAFINKCDKKQTPSDRLVLNASSAGTYKNKGKQNIGKYKYNNNFGKKCNNRNKINIQFPCATCHKYGHRKASQTSYGSLPNGVKSVEKSTARNRNSGNLNNDNNDDIIIKVSMYVYSKRIFK